MKKRVYVQLEPKEAEAVRRAAFEKNISASEYMRRATISRLKRDKALAEVSE